MGTPSLTLNDVIPPTLPLPPALLPHDQYSRVANETLWCDPHYIEYPARLFYLYKNLISVCLHVMSLSFYNCHFKLDSTEYQFHE